MPIQVTYYYDGTAKELRPCVEGTPLRLVNTLRTEIGTIIAFDAEGWAIGQLSDNGVFTPLPPQFLGLRHVSMWGTSIPLRGKPVMLQAPPDLPAIARTFIDLYKGKNENPIFFGSTEVIAVRLVNATYVYFGPIISFELHGLCGDLRRCIVKHASFELSDNVLRDGVPQGRVFVKASDLHRLIVAFDPIREEEIQNGQHPDRQ